MNNNKKKRLLTLLKEYRSTQRRQLLKQNYPRLQPFQETYDMGGYWNLIDFLDSLDGKIINHLKQLVNRNFRKDSEFKEAIKDTIMDKLQKAIR